MHQNPINLGPPLPSRRDQIISICFAIGIALSALALAGLEWARGMVSGIVRSPKRMALAIFGFAVLLIFLPMWNAQRATARMASLQQRIARVAERYARMQISYQEVTLGYAAGPNCCETLAANNNRRFPADLQCSCESEDPATSITLGIWAPKSGLRKGCVWLITPERGAEKLHCT